MTLTQLHHNDLRGFARKRQFSVSRALKRIGAALGILHRAIVSAKLQRAQNEFLSRKHYDEILSPPQDATKFPQWPLILGDKWDF